ncbi:hypothetical protein [Nostoc sp.]|uniref:hypothetical protein n=1 Tax=Nostoc sp. TaxID=1180 RepID=UPI003FA5435D
MGDHVIRSDIARKLFNVDGSGIKVGIISPSFNALSGLEADIKSGDLPGILFDTEGTRLSTLFTVTFFNDFNNNIAGFDNSANVINGQGSNDKINGLSGNDLLRGGTGNNTLIGDAGNDILVGGAGANRFLYNTNAPFALTAVGVDTINDFNSSFQGDKVILDKTTFSAFPLRVAVAIASTAVTGFSNKSDFQVTNKAGTSMAKIVYDPVSG